MKTVQKVLVSLLLATLAFTAFAVVAYSGLFSIIDTRFYSQRIRSTSREILGEAEALIDEYLLRLQQDVGGLAADPAIGNVFLVNQSRDDIERQQQLVGTLLEARSEIDYLRIIDSEEGQLWFSTLEADIRTQTEVRVEYRSIDELDPPVLLPEASQEGNRSDWIPERSALRVTVPVVDRFSIPRGVLTAWVGTSGIYALLVEEGIIGPSHRVRLTPEGYLVVNAPRHLSGDDLLSVDEAMDLESANPIIDSSIGSGFALERRTSGDGSPPLVWMIGESQMTMDTPLRVILLASVFLLTFIIVYLILNIRQDPTVVVAERFRRFQESVVKDYLREGRVVDPEIWRRELETRKDRIEREIQRGLGKVKDEAREHLEQTMQRNWDELYRLLGTRDGGHRTELEPVSLRQIEEIIERTLSRYGETMPAISERSAPGKPRTGTPSRDRPAAPATPPLPETDETVPSSQERPTPGTTPEPVEVEEVEEVEALDELEELDGDGPAATPQPVEVEEFDELDEAEELEDLEELDELEELGELEDVDAEPAEAEELDDLEELDELEDVDAEPVEADELDEAEDLEDLEELDELEDVEAEPAEAEELDELEDVDAEPAEAEELDDLEELDELEDAGAEPGEVAELDEAEEIEDLEELAELEDAGAEPAEAEEPGDLEELDELEDAGAEPAEAEELDEVEDVEAEPAEVDELDEAEEIEDLEELDELEDVEAEPAEAEELDDLEELDELEDAGAERVEVDEQGELTDAGAEPAEAESLDELEDSGAESVEADELDEAEEIEDLEELDELEDAGAEPTEPEELDDLEELDELEDAGVEPAKAEELEGLEDTGAEPVEVAELGESEELEDLEELDELEDVEAEPAEAESLDELEDSGAEPTEAESLDELEDAGAEPAEPEELDDLEELDELEDAGAEPAEAESLDELEDTGAESVEVAELGESEELEDLEELDELEDAGVEPAEAESLYELEDTGADPAEVDELDEAEDLEDLEELDELEDVDELGELEPAEADEHGELADSGAERAEADELDEAAELEDLEELDELEDVEAEPAEAEELDELEDVGVEPAEAEELDELEDTGAEPAEVEDLDELDEAEELEDLEELGELEDAGAEPAVVEELEDVEAEPTEAGELDELEDTGAESVEVAELDEAEELEDLEELDELEDAGAEPVAVAELDEAEELEDLEELDELDEAEELEDLEELGELEDAGAEPSEVEELEDAGAEPAEADELDELEDAGAEPTKAEELLDTGASRDGVAAVASALPGVDGLDEFVGEIVLDEEVGPLIPELEWLQMEESDHPVEDGTAQDAPLTVVARAETVPDDDSSADDWFRISRTALEIDEDVEERDETSRVILGRTVSSDSGAVARTMRGSEPAEAREDHSREDVETVADLETVDEDLEAVEELELLEEDSDLVEELEPVEDLAPVEELPPLEDLASVPDDEETVEELDAGDGDDEFDLESAREVEEIGERSSPFLSAYTSFGTAFETTSWRETPSPVSRPMVYRADEIRPDAVAIYGIENKGSHHVVDMDDFVAFAGKHQSVIEERDGLVRIEASAYFGEYRDVDQRTQALAEQIIHRHTSSSIDDVLGAAFADLDFGDILGPEGGPMGEGPESTDSALRVVSGGFELPYVTAAGDSGVRQVFRQLVRLTRRWDARVAVVLEQIPDGRLRASFGLGLPEDCSEELTLSPGSDIARVIVPYRRVALLKRPLSGFRDFVGTCQAQKLGAINSWLLLPLKDATSRRYLMVGFSRTFEDLVDLTHQYEIVPRAV